MGSIVTVCISNKLLVEDHTLKNTGLQYIPGLTLIGFKSTFYKGALRDDENSLPNLADVLRAELLKFSQQIYEGSTLIILDLQMHESGSLA